MQVDIATEPTDDFFEPVTLGALELRNRWVMAPMTRAFSPNGVPGMNVRRYYERRARGGVGLIITEGTFVPHAAASNNGNVPNFHGAEALAGWKAVVDAVHAAGSLMVPQLWHVGLIQKRIVSNISLVVAEHPQVSPSGYLGASERVGEAMSIPDIEAVILAFGEAATSARELGFDGIEIHGAHGYLIDQFFWATTNRRSDAFGGDLATRSRFATEVVRECRRRVGPEFPIIFRFSQWKQQDYTARLANSPQELETVLAPLVKAGVDIFHCSQRRYWHPEFPDDSSMSLAGWTRRITGKPSIIVGSVGLDKDLSAAGFAPGAKAGWASLVPLQQMFQRGEFDLVALGRALIGNPEWCELIRSGQIHRIRGYSQDFLGELD